MVLLEEEELTLEALGIEDDSQILLEVRNKDLTWPEEMGSLQQQQLDRRRQSMLGWFLNLDLSICCLLSLLFF